MIYDNLLQAAKSVLIEIEATGFADHGFALTDEQNPWHDDYTRLSKAVEELESLSESLAKQAIEPTTMHFIGDGWHKGTNFYWSERRGQWVVVDLENNRASCHDSLALVRCSGDPDEGLNQECLGCDFEDPAGLWLVDGEYVDECSEGYLYDVCMLDGCTPGLPAFDLVAKPHEDDKQFCIDSGENWIEDETRINDTLHEHWHHGMLSDDDRGMKNIESSSRRDMIPALPYLEYMGNAIKECQDFWDAFDVIRDSIGAEAADHLYSLYLAGAARRGDCGGG